MNILRRARAVLNAVPEAEVLEWTHNDGVGDFYVIDREGLRRMEEECDCAAEFALNGDRHKRSNERGEQRLEQALLPMSEIPESTLREVFGDHVRIRYTRGADSFEVGTNYAYRQG